MTPGAETQVGKLGTHLKRVRWLVLRGARMSPLEVRHRFREQARRMVDRRQNASWSRFGHFDPTFRPIAGLQSTFRQLPSDLRDAIASSAAEIRARRFTFLNQAWPPTDDNELWFIDPVTGSAWPNAEVAASRVRYRHQTSKGDVKFVWEINRLQMLPVLALAGDEAAGEIAPLLQAWMQANPPFGGINWTNGIETASRLVSLLAARSASDQADFKLSQADCAFAEAHVHHLERYPSLFSSANNHRVAELAGIFIAASCLPDLPRADRRRDQARRDLEAEVFRQFHADGIGAEQSPTYAAYSLEWFALASIVGDETDMPFSGQFRTRLAAAADALCWFCDERGQTPALGDDDAGRVLSLAEAPEQRYCASVVNLVGRWLKRDDLRLPSDPALRDLIAAAPMQSHVKSPSEAPVRQPRNGTKTFEQGGWTVFREARHGRSLMLAFDHAPLGFLSIAAHGHADALAVVLTVGPDPVFIDAGTFLYHGGADERDRMRGTLAHNTVAVDGSDQSIIAGPFSWRQHARTKLIGFNDEYVEAEHDGYLRRYGVKHVRRLQQEGDGLYRIDDRLVRTQTGPTISWTLGFTLDPAIAVTLDGRRATLRTQSGRTIIATAAQPWALRQVDMSPSFNIKKPTSRLHLHGAMTLSDDPSVSTVTIAVALR